MMQPPSGGCVLKQGGTISAAEIKKQPPSGGCVLKPYLDGIDTPYIEAAAFGRLCVETNRCRDCDYCRQAAAFGRLCVETTEPSPWQNAGVSSRLRAAVC